MIDCQCLESLKEQLQHRTYFNSSSCHSTPPTVSFKSTAIITDFTEVANYTLITDQSQLTTTTTTVAATTMATSRDTTANEENREETTTLVIDENDHEKLIIYVLSGVLGLVVLSMVLVWVLFKFLRAERGVTGPLPPPPRASRGTPRASTFLSRAARRLAQGGPGGRVATRSSIYNPGFSSDISEIEMDN